MGEGKTHRAAQPVAHTAHRTNAARGPWRLLPGRLLGTAHQGLHEQKAVTGDREPTCFSRPSRPSGQFLAFVVEKNHTYRYFSNHRIYSANPIKETMAEGGWGGVRYVCTSQILSHTHTHLPQGHRRHFLSHRLERGQRSRDFVGIGLQRT